MKDSNQPRFPGALRPYFIILLAGLAAFAPVSLLLKALKNDIIVLEYPINYFISQCIHNAEMPYWFNTWGMGFPLQGNLTWGIYSTPQLFFCTAFEYNIYILHIEFMFFVVLSGWSMFYLLKKHFVKDMKLAQTLAICYMLSGFMAGSSQWLLYITAAAFIPLIVHSLLQLLKLPSFFHAFQFAVIYFLMFTSVYAAFNIITSYSLLIFLVFYFARLLKERKKLLITLSYALLAAILVFLLCFPCLYYTIESLQYMDRGNAIAHTDFFNSNSLPPASLSSLLLPFSSVRMVFDNTEPTMFDCYAGLFTILLLPVALIETIKKKNKRLIIFAAVALFFLILSFGSLSPLRSALNILPGFSYFRNPGLFRFYFIFSILIYLAIAFRDNSWKDFLVISKEKPALKLAFFFYIALCLVIVFVHAGSLKGFSYVSLSETLRNITYKQAALISSSLQLLLLLLLFVLLAKKRFNAASYIFIADLVINTLACTPYFTVSSYSLPQVSNILASTGGFPVQEQTPVESPALYQDRKMNTWYNVNVYRKEVSTQDTYRGPLTLRQFPGEKTDTSSHPSCNYSIIRFDRDSMAAGERINIVLQHPTHIRVSVSLAEPATITAFQNYFPGWKAFYNDRSLAFVEKDKPGLSVMAPKGVGTIDFVYEKKGIWRSALLLHLIVAVFLLIKAARIIKKVVFRKSSAYWHRKQ